MNTACLGCGAESDRLYCAACLAKPDGRPLRRAQATTEPVRGAKAAAKLPRATEAQIQAEIVAWLELHGWACYQNTVRGVKPKGVTPGIPDLFACRDRELAWVECKRPKDGRVSEAQAECHARLRAAGQRVLVAYGIEDVAELT